MRYLLLLPLLILVLVGCTSEKYSFWDNDGTFCVKSKPNDYNCIDYVRQSQVEELQIQIDQLKDYLGVVKWTDKTIYYLTSDPLKVEWVELECNKYNNLNWSCDVPDGEIKCKPRCLEIKEKL